MRGTTIYIYQYIVDSCLIQQPSAGSTATIYIYSSKIKTVEFFRVDESSLRFEVKFKYDEKIIEVIKKCDGAFFDYNKRVMKNDIVANTSIVGAR